MACIQDCRLAIFNKAFEEAKDAGFTFIRTSDDTIQITGAKDHTSANRLANNLLVSMTKSFNGHVFGEVNGRSKFDPVTVRIEATQKYVDHIYNTQPFTEQSPNQQTTSPERDYINTGTGANTYDQTASFSPDLDENADVGEFEKFIKHKVRISNGYKNKLNRINQLLKNKNLTTDEITKLKRQQRELNLQISGNYELNIRGIDAEIREIMASKNSLTIDSIKYYVEKDLERLDALVKSNDLFDLEEADRIIKFYTLAGDFSWTESPTTVNPFFPNREDMFLQDENGEFVSVYKIPEEIIDQLREWSNQAKGYRNELDKKYEEVTTDIVNSDYSVKKTYGDKKFTFEELVYKNKGLKDTSIADMWTMDVTNGIFSTNGLLPQVAFSYISNMLEGELGWARDIEKRVDDINSDVMSELKKINETYASKGIIGINGASFELYKEKTKEGNETNALVNRYSREFADEQARAMEIFQTEFEYARGKDDATIRINNAFEKLKAWRRANTIIIDFTKLPEIEALGEFSELGITGDSAYKNELIFILGQRGYDQEVANQISKLRKYVADRESMKETILIQEGKGPGDVLSPEGNSAFDFWKMNHSPLRGIEDYNSITGLRLGELKINSFMDYNHFIPRKQEVTVGTDIENNKYTFAPTGKTTDNYSKQFEIIENNATLLKFYDIVKEVSDKIRESLPYELQRKVAVNTLPGLAKTSAEYIAGSKEGATGKEIPFMTRMWKAFGEIMDRVRTSFGVVKQSDISYATIDPVTGKANYRINDAFLQNNSEAIGERITIERNKFLQAFNSNRASDKLYKVSRFTAIKLDSMNTESLILLCNYMRIDIPLEDIKARRLDKLKSRLKTDRTGAYAVEIGRLIRDFSIHSVVQSQSFDLAKMTKYFSNLAMSYSARNKALPVIEIMKKHYESILAPETNNVKRPLFNMTENRVETSGERTHGKKQFNDWFERVILGNYGGKHTESNREEDEKQLSPEKLKELNNQIAELEKSKQGKSLEEMREIDNRIYRLQSKKVISRFSKSLYTTEQRLKVGELQSLIEKSTDENEIAQFKQMQKGLGKTRTVTAAIDNMLSWTRTLKLGYNASSAVTNFMEGLTSNMVLASTGEYFKSEEIYYGYRISKWSFAKNLSFGKIEHPLAKKSRSLMDKFNVIMDSKNELQKSSHKTYASRFSWANPHELNQRVEFINQSPIMIAMLRSMEITGLNGEKSSVWDAYDKEGKLKPEFRTEENINSWENLKGEQYLNFKQKLHKAIVLGHGNYDELRGMMIKSNSVGKALMMFKTWLPQAIYWRFATKQDDIQSGTQGFKGRYTSYGAGSAGLHGAVVGFASFGPVGAAIGWGVGAGLGYKFGTHNGVGLLKETIGTAKALALKALGMPINLLSGGRTHIGEGGKEFEEWAKNSTRFTIQDAKNLKANMADITLQLAWIMSIILVKAMFWDDDDEKDSPQRIAHNIAVNKLMQLSTSAAGYTSIPSIYKNTIGSMAIVSYLEDLGKEVTAIEKLVEGNDLISSGVNAGESRLANQTSKIFMPGIFKDSFFGFETESQRVFTEPPTAEWFKSEERKEKNQNKAERAALRLELQESPLYLEIEDSKERKKEIEKEINRQLPTPTQLQKLEMTREEYEEMLEADSE